MPFAEASDLTATPIWSMLNINSLLSPVNASVPFVGPPARASTRHCTRHASAFPKLPHDLFYQFIGIALVLGDFRSISCHGVVSQMLACTLQQRIAQHLT